MSKPRTLAALVVLPAIQAGEILASCWGIDALDDLGELVAGTVPVPAAAR